MDRAEFVSNFSKRLNDSFQRKGYASHRSQAKIDIKQLAKIAGVSYQMARKYALGLALPEYHIIPKIARWLNVSSSWLLYGENASPVTELKSPTLIEIESELLKYILQKCSVLFFTANEVDKIVRYIVGVIYDASHINADSKTILKVIDMMLSSAMQLSEFNKEKRA